MARALVVLIAVTALSDPARAQPWPDGDRVVDVDATVGCRAVHAAGAAAAPACPRFTRVTPAGVALYAPVVFEYDKATLRPSNWPLLDELVAQLAAHPALRLEIAGHYRQEPYRARVLSRDRAEAVRRYLIHRGIAADRLVAQGYGETRPIVMPRTDRRNWRIELTAIP